MPSSSHTRTVVRMCCKGDDESLGERGKFYPPPPENPLTDGHQNLCYVGDIYHHAKCYRNRFRSFGSAHAWFRAPRLFFGLLMRKATAETRAPIFDEKYVKRRGSAQGSAFWGSRNQYLRFGFHFPPKPPFLGTISTGLRFFFARKRL